MLTKMLIKLIHKNSNKYLNVSFCLFSDSTSRSCVSFRNCLDLYEEILTEEGTAKEATYNDV